MTNKNYHLPHTRQEMREILDDKKGIDQLAALPEDGLISRKALCSLVGVDIEAFEEVRETDRLVWSGFVQWFHRYLKLLRDEGSKHVDAPFMLPIPNKGYDETDEGSDTFVALIKLRGVKAAAYVLTKQVNDLSRLHARHAAEQRLLFEDSHLLDGVPARKKGNLQALLIATTSNLEGLAVGAKQLASDRLMNLPNISHVLAIS